MGPDDYGSFENPEAEEWIETVLLMADDISPVRIALDRLAGIRRKPDRRECRAAVAAAEIVAALGGRPRKHLPDDVAAWVAAHPHPIDSGLRNRAAQAIARVLYEPAMQEGWERHADAEEWRRQLNELHDRVEGRESPPQRALTLGNDALASNPARTQLDPVRWARFYPFWPVFWLAVLIGGGLLGWQQHEWRLSVGCLVLNVFYWFRVKEHFAHGDSNPGLVVSVKPPRLAVATDLTRGEGYFPALKIVRCRLRRSGGRPLAIGMIVPTVSLYRTKPGSDRYATFDPLPLECGTADPAAYHAAMGTYTAQSHAFLHELVRRAPSHKAGLYRFNEDTLEPL